MINVGAGLCPTPLNDRMAASKAATRYVLETWSSLNSGHEHGNYVFTVLSSLLYDHEYKKAGDKHLRHLENCEGWVADG